MPTVSQLQKQKAKRQHVIRLNSAVWLEIVCFGCLRVNTNCVFCWNGAGSGQHSVVLTFPIYMLDSPTSRGLLMQLRAAVALMVEDTTVLYRSMANRTTFLGTAVHTLHKILESGHCNNCLEGKGGCSFCRAVMFRDFVHVTIQGELGAA